MCSAIFGLIARILLPLFSTTPAATQPSLPPDAPPRASLIQVSAPNAAGEVTVTGRSGAVTAGYGVVLVTLETGHLAFARAAADGSFSGSLFAPAGASVLVKAGPMLGVSAQNSADVAEILVGLPGTILRVADAESPGQVIAFAATGIVSPNTTLSIWKSGINFRL